MCDIRRCELGRAASAPQYAQQHRFCRFACGSHEGSRMVLRGNSLVETGFGRRRAISRASTKFAIKLSTKKGLKMSRLQPPALLEGFRSRSILHPAFRIRMAGTSEN